MEGEKTEQPTPRKLKKARDRGEVWKSVDVTHTAEFIVMMGLGWLAVELYLPHLRSLFDAWPVLIAQLGSEPGALPADHSPRAALEQAISVWLAAMAVAILVPLAVGVMITALQVRGVFSLEPLVPKAERLNPGANLKRLFQSRNLIDLVKTLVKVSFVGVAVYLTIRAGLPQWMHAVANATPVGIAALLGRSLLVLALTCLAIYVFMAAVDFAHQFYEYIKQQRMTKDEVRREYKEIEGDPYIKSHRRALGMQMAMEAPNNPVSQARVVVTNPTHLSVALGYDAASGGLPTVVAKGAGAAAMAIRHEARKLGIPVVENKPLARQLYAQVGVGAFITADSFAEVARLLAALPRISRAASDSWGRV